MKKYFNYLLIAIIAFNSFSCEKFVAVEPGTNLVQSADVFTNDQQALSAIAGMYTALRNSNFLMLNGGLSVYGGLAADELYATSPTTTTDPFYLNQLLSTNATFNSNFYAHCYKVIYQANAIIEGATASALLSPATKLVFTSEAKCMRAFLYFQLLQLFGEIPLVLSTDYLVNATLPRATKADVYKQIVSDLTEAKNLLPISYPSIGKARPNRQVAAAMLATVYLYGGEWAHAVEACSDVINSGNYTLVSSSAIGSVFLKGSTETIWEIANTSDISVPGDPAIFIPSSSTTKPAYSLTASLLGAFESGDLRKTNWLGKNTISSSEYWYPFKYKQKTVATGATPTEYQVVLRLATIYLARAEAYAQLNNVMAAQTDLNKIRNRAGLMNNSASTKEALLAAIEKENQTEFFTEQGYRWKNLLRTSRADIVIGGIKTSTWQPTDKLWPIPENEITYNPFLYQNPGY